MRYKNTPDLIRAITEHGKEFRNKDAAGAPWLRLMHHSGKSCFILVQSGLVVNDIFVFVTGGGLIFANTGNDKAVLQDLFFCTIETKD